MRHLKVTSDPWTLDHAGDVLRGIPHNEQKTVLRICRDRESAETENHVSDLDVETKVEMLTRMLRIRLF